MNTFRQFAGRIKLQWRGKHHIVGWGMKPEEATAYLRGLGKTMLTFYGYTVKYEDPEGMLKIVRDVLSEFFPETTLVNAGATGSLGAAVYPTAKSMGFITTGIVSTMQLQYPDEIIPAVDHICFIEDTLWGGNLPNSTELSPTSKAMVECSDILVAIGGNEIARDELLAAQAMGRQIRYFPADMDHESAFRRAKYLKLPPPESFHGAVHEVFGK